MTSDLLTRATQPLTSTLASGGNPSGGFWLPERASTAAAGSDFMFDFITWLSYFFFVLIVAVMLYFVVRYRQRGNDVVTHDDAPTHNTPLEVTWTILPLLLCIGIFFMGFRGYLNLATPPSNTYDIEVRAWKWAWQFKYPNGAVSDDLYIPAGKPVKLVMSSDDVLHSLYIPNFRTKKDVVPGRYSYMWFEAPVPTGGPSEGMKATDSDNPGHWLFCTEYCGDQHWNMNRRVYVLPEGDFAEWVANQAVWIDEIPDEELYFKAGPRLYNQCSACHSIDGSSGTGPTWAGTWDRARNGTGVVHGGSKFVAGRTSLSDYIGAGKLYETPEDYLVDSIHNPGALLVEVDGKAYGNAMPAFKGSIEGKKLDALIGMLKRIEEFNDDGSYKGEG